MRDHFAGQLANLLPLRERRVEAVSKGKRSVMIPQLAFKPRLTVACGREEMSMTALGGKGKRELR